MTSIEFERHREEIYFSIPVTHPPNNKSNWMCVTNQFLQLLDSEQSVSDDAVSSLYWVHHTYNSKIYVWSVAQ